MSPRSVVSNFVGLLMMLAFVAALVLVLIAVVQPAEGAGDGLPDLSPGYWVRELHGHGYACNTAYLPEYGFEWGCTQALRDMGSTGSVTLTQWGHTWEQVAAMRADLVGLPLTSGDYVVSMVGMFASTPFTGMDPEAAPWAQGVAKSILETGNGYECRVFGDVEYCVYGGTRSGLINMWLVLTGD